MTTKEMEAMIAQLQQRNAELEAAKGRQAVNIKVEGNELVLRVPMKSETKRSSTGNSDLVATASGPTGIMGKDGREMRVTFTAYFQLPKSERKAPAAAVLNDAPVAAKAQFLSL